MTTAQEKLWGSSFGDDYTARQSLNLLNTQEFFTRALHAIPWPSIGSVIEFGANEGHNLEALRTHAALMPDAILDGVEINAKAHKELVDAADHALLRSMLDWLPARQWQLTVSKGLLIHIHPDDLPKAYRVLYQSSSRYILIAEYFNPVPITVEYRGEKEALWKRDFGADMLDRFSDLVCLDYGFVWKRDDQPQDNLTWWLFKK